jgi:DNA-binding CsgD family transcriptional regulator
MLSDEPGRRNIMAPSDQLSKREQEVVELLLRGMSNQQIAQNLGIAERTVEFHLNHIYTKLGVSSRAEAILLLGKTTVGADEKPKESTVENEGKSAYDEGAEARPKSNRAVIYVLVLVIGIVIFTMYFLQTQKKGSWRFEREAEYPDEFTVGQDLGRSNASGKKVHGQFGAESVSPWNARPGFVKYYNINVEQGGHLYLQIRYSKYSRSYVPILIYIDDERDPRKSFYPSDQGDWNNFTLTERISLGDVKKGNHSLTFSTNGQDYGVADLDKFMLITEPP